MPTFMKMNHSLQIKPKTNNNNNKNKVNVVKPWEPQINHDFATLIIV